MTKEEKQAIDVIKEYYQDFAYEHKYPYLRESIDIILDLIDEQQKEIKKQERAIDKMAKCINDTDYFYIKRCEKCANNNIENNNERECIKCIKNHFLRGVK